MLELERFLPGFNHIICGNPPKSALAQIESKLRTYRESTLSELVGVFGSWIPVSSLKAKRSKANSRQRDFSQSVTFWAFLWQVLTPQTSCREVVRKTQSFCCERKLRVPGSNTAAYCKARSRLAVEDIDSVHTAVSTRALNQVREEQRWLGHDVKVIDGTGIKLADTVANQKQFPQPGEQREGCGFPVMKVVACFCLASGTLIEWVETALKTHESRILKRMLHLFQKDDVILTDRGFSSYTNIVALMSQGAHAVMRVHQMRKLDYRKGKRLGKHDRIVTWKRAAARAKGWSLADWKALPEELEVRVVRIFLEVKGFRVRKYDLVTTLKDPTHYTKENLSELYYRRWAVELYFRHIKTTMGMEKLRCQTPEMARKELRMYVIAYNLIRGLMQEAAQAWQCPLDRISFKSSVDTLRLFDCPLNATRNQPRAQQRIINEMLRIIASEQVPLRIHRSEPRALKERPKPYPRLTSPRSVYIVPKSRKNKGKRKLDSLNKTA